MEIVETSGAFVRVPAGLADQAANFPANAPVGSGSAVIRYTAIGGGLTYVITRSISYTYPNNFYTETYTFEVPSGNTDPVQFYLGGDAAPGNSDAGRAAMTTSPNRVLYEINPFTGIFIAYGEVGSPAISPFSSGYVAAYSNPVYGSIRRGYSLVTGCGVSGNQQVVDTNFCIDNVQHDAGLDIQWTLPADPGTTRTYSRQMRTIVGFQGQSVSARFSPTSVSSGQSSDLVIELVNTTFNSVAGVGFDLPLPTGLTISGAATNNCNGTLSAGSGGASVSLSGGNLPAGGNCLVTVPVSGAPGNYTVNDQDFQNLAPGTLTKGFGTTSLRIEAPPPTNILAIAKTGVGEVTSSPRGIDCGERCAAAFLQGTQVTLSANPAQGYTFAGWGGSCSGTGTCEVTLSQNRNVTASFLRSVPTYALTLQKQGTGTGTVTSNPSGINCGTACEASYEEGTQVTLTASAAQGSTFTGWSGACSGTAPCQVTMDQARQVSATFQRVIPSYTLAVTKPSDGQGTVTSNPSGINCGAACEASFEEGTQVTLTASAAQGSTFTGWSGACSGTGSCQVTMDQARQVSATFQRELPRTLTLSVTKQGTGTGTVTSNPSGINCGVACQSSYEEGTEVTLTASAAQGSTFTGWSGACSGTGSCQVTMDQARQVAATFTVAEPPRLSITKYRPGPRRLNATKIIRMAWVECVAGTCQIDGGTASFKARGKTFSGNPNYSKEPFEAGERRLMSITVPAAVNDRLTSRKSGVAILNITASARSGGEVEEIDRTVRQGLRRCPDNKCR